MADVIGKTACPDCRKRGADRTGDNLVMYSDGGRYCFACGFTVLSDEYQMNREVVEMGSAFNEDVHTDLKNRTIIGEVDYRGIRANTARYFGVRYDVDEDNNVTRSYYPATKRYRISGYKIRRHPKVFETPIGEVGKECDMFGQFRFKTHNGICVICPGEIDQLTAYQILDDNKKTDKFDSIAVVSSTIGEGGTFKQVQENYDWFNQFKKIVVCMDDDDAGENAAKTICEVLPEGKAFIMKMRYKDPNSYIWDKERNKPLNNASEFITDFWAARQYGLEGIKTAAEGFDEIIDEVTRPRITLPPYMHKMQDMMGGGMLQGRICSIIAFTSVGKSTHVDRMVYHWIYNTNLTPTIVSLEATAGQYMLNMLSLHMQKNLMWTKSPEQLVEFILSEEGQALKRDLCFREDGSPRFFILDEREGDIKQLEKSMEKMSKKHNSKLYVIDVLSDLLRGSSAEHAEDHMAWQKKNIKDGITIINVMHTRKPPQSGDGKLVKTTEYDALGTGSFVQSAAYNIVLNRDKLNPDPLVQNSTEVDLPKCRGGKTGSAGSWYYDFGTVKCYDLDDWVEANPINRDSKADF